MSFVYDLYIEIILFSSLMLFKPHSPVRTYPSCREPLSESCSLFRFEINDLESKINLVLTIPSTHVGEGNNYRLPVIG